MKMIRSAVPNSRTRDQLVPGSGNRENPLSWAGPHLLSHSRGTRGFTSVNGRSSLTLQFDGGADSNTFSQSIQSLGYEPIVIPVREPVPPPSGTRRPKPQPPAEQGQRADLTMVTSADICTQFQVSKRTLQKWRREGKFPEPDLVIGTTVRWLVTTVEDWIENHRQKRGVKRPRRPD